MLQQILWIFGLVVSKMQSFFSIKSTSANWDMPNGEKVQGDTKKTVITKNRITSKFYLDWHKTSATLGQACVGDISKVSILYYKNS